MALPRVSLNSFLATAKATLNTGAQHAQPITFVVGNESADLDSICSAIAYAYIRTYTSIPPNVHVPIANIPAADVSLRTELGPILSHAGIKTSELITLTDLPHPSKRTALLSPEKTRWLLVDHNSLQGELGQVYGDRVVGCIDHHDEENKVPKDCGSEPRIVEKAGSCASLIVNHCKEAWDKLSHGDEAANYDSAWARIALAPVLIDTANLKNKNKVTKHDITAAEALEKILRSSSPDKYDLAPVLIDTANLKNKNKVTKHDITAAETLEKIPRSSSPDRYGRDFYYTEINDAKEAIDDLSLNDILRKDYKQWTEGQGVNLGMSSAIKDVRFLLDKVKNEESFWKEVHAFAEARKLSVCAVMTSFTHNGQYSREILLLGLDEAGVKAAKTFEKMASEELGLQGWESGRLDSIDSKTQWRRCWVQNNLGMSRKQVGPLLRKSIL
ncbi:hypothetical protein V499_01651 [Pseudogymnoascus sp. VKM F-103]|uniref:Exopolyphosphatase n=1 Tax=Pseudogymnoascus verrucosus TaxID=342668 RepID=A0A1B8GXB4_9PEZI|nr:Exopolyphosphatase [Pseudogymnoascus verrucosus]KFY79353.1 hypothetical protein V499_01651 [Pseudogymnoascus sp. VKM F-103]OBU00447.1 Exopolyphosphatase [Pseudogymnoascus verrucosus]